MMILLFPSRANHADHLSTRPYAKLVDAWVTAIELRGKTTAPIRFDARRPR